jgi:hypothetical protein
MIAIYKRSTDLDRVSSTSNTMHVRKTALKYCITIQEARSILEAVRDSRVEVAAFLEQRRQASLDAQVRFRLYYLSLSLSRGPSATESAAQQVT